MQRALERYGVGIVAGSVVTVGLLYLMQAAISNEENPLNEAPPTFDFEVIRLMEDTEPRPKPPKQKPPPPPDEFPPDIPEPEHVLDGPEGWSKYKPNTVTPTKTDFGPGVYSGVGEYLPIVKVQPKYPRTAAQRGIEGYVIVQFTVTENGNVENPTVVESYPRGVFDRAATQAALKFKYRPRVVDGTPIRVEGVKNRIVFELEDEP